MCIRDRRKDVVDILLPQHLNGPLGGPRQLLVDENIGAVSYTHLI